MTTAQLIVLALFATATANAQNAINLEDLELVQETKVSNEEFLGSLYEGDAAPSKGNYPDRLHDGNYPDRLHDANYPDRLHDGNYPDRLHDANYPDRLHGASAVPREKSMQLPLPRPSKGNYPDIVRDGNYPNITRDANYPDILRDGNYPDIIRDANYPDITRGSNLIPGMAGTQRIPAPKVKK